MRRDVLVLLAIIAVLAYFFYPRATPPEPTITRKDPGCDVMLTAIGPLPPGLLERLQGRVHGLRVAVGLPVLGLEAGLDGLPGSAVQENLVMPGLETQVENLGARKIAVTALPLETVDSELNLIPHIAYWGRRAAVLTTSGMPSEDSLYQLLELTLQGQGRPPQNWGEVTRRGG